MQPFVVTLMLDAEVQRRFDAERARWFPAGRTKVGAHVTLFHAIPGDIDVVDLLVAQAGPAFEVLVARVMSLGRGAAYALESAELTRRHRTLQQAWWPHLTRQDQQPLRAHVTVQNKVGPDVARATVETLRTGFAPFTVHALGWQLWRYDDGPWTHLTDVSFA